MPRKDKSSISSQLYVVTIKNGIDSVYASAEAAKERAAILKGQEAPDGTIKIELHELNDGIVRATNVRLEGSNSTASNANTGALKPGEVEVEAGAEASKAETTKKRANNSTDAVLPENVQQLLSGTGDVLSGLMIVVTGMQSTFGRKTVEKLITAYGGHLTRSLSRNTSYVILGDDTGPKKLELIEDLGVETLDEFGLIDMIESSLGGEGAGMKMDFEVESEEEVPNKKQRF